VAIKIPDSCSSKATVGGKTRPDPTRQIIAQDGGADVAYRLAFEACVAFRHTDPLWGPAGDCRDSANRLAGKADPVISSAPSRPNGFADTIERDVVTQRTYSESITARSLRSGIQP